jgi:hypothetical protein
MRVFFFFLCNTRVRALVGWQDQRLPNHWAIAQSAIERKKREGKKKNGDIEKEEGDQAPSNEFLHPPLHVITALDNACLCHFFSS